MTDTALSPAAEAALDVIRHHRVGVSFVEIVAAVDAAGIDTDGEHALCHTDDPNIVLWAGVSEQVIDAVSTLLRRNLVHMTATQPLTYLIDGQFPTFPIAQKPPRAGYKEPHWLPVVLNAGPGPDQGGRKSR